MDLIDALAAGVRGAENGTASILKRGTSTRAQYYLDFEGQSPVLPVVDIALDSNGSTVAYVNELCTVEVKSSAGVLVRTFTAGHVSGAVEYQGQSFTGTDYISGISAASKPTQLQAILDLWLTNSGAIDWKVLVGSTATKLSAFATAVGGVFYNVKDPTYGAKGDLVTDDTTAIQGALTAAGNAGGGIVVFPPAGYRITSVLTVPNGVSLIGAGPSATEIAMDHASNNTLTWSGSNDRTQFVAGIYFDHMQACTGHPLVIPAAELLKVSDCVIGNANGLSRGTLITVADSSATFLLFEDCLFKAGASTASCVVASGAMGNAVFDRCTFRPNAGAYGSSMIVGNQVALNDCVFDNSPATSGTYYCYSTLNVGGVISAYIQNCTFKATGGATVTAMLLGVYPSTTSFCEDGNIFGSGVTAYNYTSDNTNIAANVVLGSREKRYKLYTSSAGGVITVDTDQYANIFVDLTTGAAAATLTLRRAPNGARGTIIIYNESGGTLNGNTYGVSSLSPPTSNLTNGQHGSVAVIWQANATAGAVFAISVPGVS